MRPRTAGRPRGPPPTWSLSRRAAHLAAFLMACGLSACHDPDIGRTCLKDTDCPDALECEVEHGKGTCQEHHDADDEAGDDSNDDDTNGDDSNGDDSNGRPG